jgi:hypothetical protein
VKTDQRLVTFAVEVPHKLLKTLTSICALFIWVRCGKFLLFKRPTYSKQKTPVPVCILRVDVGLPRGNGEKLRVKMLTSAKIAKQNGDTLTRKSDPGYLNLSNIILYYLRYISRDQNSSYDDK